MKNQSFWIGVAIAVVGGLILWLITDVIFPQGNNASPSPPPTIQGTQTPDSKLNLSPNPSNSSESTPDQSPEPKGLKLEDAINIGTNLRESYNVVDNYGNSYLVAYRFPVSSLSSYETLLDSKYSTFTGTFFVEEGTTFNGKYQIFIICDDETVFFEEITKTSHPIEVTLDISGVNHFNISTKYNNFRVYIADGHFHP